MTPDGRQSVNSVQDRLDAIVGEFADLDGREKLELLVDFANGLPPLSPAYEARKSAEDRRVHECQTPVFLWTEVENGRAKLTAEVAPEAPTVKGFVAILAEAVNGRPIGDVAALSDDFLDRMGLIDILGMMRARGLRAIVARVKRGFVQCAAAGS
jgi:cysteine desulfuration protein SufE